MNKAINVKVSEENSRIKISITDPGKGFTPSAHLEITPEKLFTPFGKHIAIAYEVFGNLEFLNKGKTIEILLE